MAMDRKPNPKPNRHTWFHVLIITLGIAVTTLGSKLMRDNEKVLSPRYGIMRRNGLPTIAEGLLITAVGAFCLARSRRRN
jgi:hypothetical protein